MTPKYVVDDYEASAAATEGREYANKINWLRLDPGVHFMRVLPPLESMVHPDTGKAPFYWLVPVHFGIHPGNKRPVFCPRRASKGVDTCAICDIWLPFVRKDSTATAQERQVALDFLPKWQNYMNVMLLDNKTGEPVRDKDGAVVTYVWGAGNDIVDKILRRMEEAKEEEGEWPSLTHPKHGRILRIERVGKTKEDTEYDATIKKAFDITPYAEWWEESLIDLPEINPLMTTDQVAALVTGPSGDAFEAPALASGEEEADEPEVKKGGAFDDDEAIEAEFTRVEEEDKPATPARRRRGSGSAKLAELLGD